MSWQQYSTNMTQSGLPVNAIFGLDGNPWAQSDNFKPTASEVLAVINGIKSQSFPNGIILLGVKYTVIRVSDDCVTAKCRGAAREEENYLVHFAKAKTCFVFGGMCGPNERNVTKLVEDVRDYLVKCNM